mmetsp:Transcript_57845/g.164346  ORF Transcript_57845/g.164346 Transcript_57845/m.164346 type:complete len:274 (-) Transcript_57845:276-1097(-)
MSGGTIWGLSTVRAHVTTRSPRSLNVSTSSSTLAPSSTESWPTGSGMPLAFTAATLSTVVAFGSVPAQSAASAPTTSLSQAGQAVEACGQELKRLSQVPVPCHCHPHRWAKEPTQWVSCLQALYESTYALRLCTEVGSRPAPQEVAGARDGCTGPNSVSTKALSQPSPRRKGPMPDGAGPKAFTPRKVSEGHQVRMDAILAWLTPANAVPTGWSPSSRRTAWATHSILRQMHSFPTSRSTASSTSFPTVHHSKAGDCLWAPTDARICERSICH